MPCLLLRSKDQIVNGELKNCGNSIRKHSGIEKLWQ